MSEKRRDSKNRVLRSGESQRKDGRYAYKYIDTFGCGGVHIAVERGALVWVFAVAHVLHFNPALVELAGELADFGRAAQNVV